MTGPAPLGGGFNPPGSETQPTLGLGEKFGGVGALSAAPVQSKLTATDKEENLNMATSR